MQLKYSNEMKIPFYHYTIVPLKIPSLNNMYYYTTENSWFKQYFNKPFYLKAPSMNHFLLEQLSTLTIIPLFLLTIKNLRLPTLWMGLTNRCNYCSLYISFKNQFSSISSNTFSWRKTGKYKTRKYKNNLNIFWILTW